MVMDGEFEVMDIVCKIGDTLKYVVVDIFSEDERIVLARVWSDGKRVVPCGKVLTRQGQVDYIKVGKWLGKFGEKPDGDECSISIGMEVDDEY